MKLSISVALLIYMHVAWAYPLGVEDNLVAQRRLAANGSNIIQSCILGHVQLCNSSTYGFGAQLPWVDSLLVCYLDDGTKGVLNVTLPSTGLDCTAADGSRDQESCTPVAGGIAEYAHRVGGYTAGVAIPDLDSWEASLSRSAGLRIPPSAAWGVTPPQLAWLAAQGSAADITLAAGEDRHLGWWGLAQGLRRTAAFGGQGVRAVPYNMDQLLLFYRRDALAAASLSAPQTWDELLAAARALRSAQQQCSTDEAGCYGHGFCLFLPAGCSNDGVVLGAVWASMAAVAGPTAGAYWDVDGMAPRLGGTAMEEALRTYRELTTLGPPGLPLCGRLDFVTARRTCAMGIVVSSAARLMGFSGGGANGSRNSSRLWGQAGIAPLPGSRRVQVPADGASAPLRLCTRDLCPLAEPHPDPAAEAAGVLVNRAPHPGRGPYFAAVSAVAAPMEQLAAWRALVWALSPDASWRGVLDPGMYASPLRDEQLSEEAVERFVAAGWHSQDAADYLAALRHALSHPNAVPPLRFLGGEVITQLLGAAAAQAADPAGPAPAAIAQALLNNLSAAFPGGYLLIQKSYMESVGILGAAGSSGAGGPSSPSSSPAPARSSPRRGGLSSKDRVGIAVGVGVVAGAVLLAASVYTKRRALSTWLGLSLSAKDARRGSPGMPGFGAETTLLVTDIQDSTLLWEALPAVIMDLALNMHNHCVRQLVRRFNGYECHTEGDSFTLAFHSAVEATAFALELQIALMDVEWPSLLLEHPSAAEVFLTTRAEAEAAAAAAGSALGADLATGSPAGAAFSVQAQVPPAGPSLGPPAVFGVPSQRVSETSSRTTPPSQRLLPLGVSPQTSEATMHSGVGSGHMQGQGSFGVLPGFSHSASLQEAHRRMAHGVSSVSARPGETVLGGEADMEERSADVADGVKAGLWPARARGASSRQRSVPVPLHTTQGFVDSEGSEMTSGGGGHGQVARAGSDRRRSLSGEPPTPAEVSSGAASPAALANSPRSAGAALPLRSRSHNHSAPHDVAAAAAVGRSTSLLRHASLNQCQPGSASRPLPPTASHVVQLAGSESDAVPGAAGATGAATSASAAASTAGPPPLLALATSNRRRSAIHSPHHPVGVRLPSPTTGVSSGGMEWGSGLGSGSTDLLIPSGGSVVGRSMSRFALAHGGRSGSRTWGAAPQGESPPAATGAEEAPGEEAVASGEQLGVGAPVRTPAAAATECSSRAASGSSRAPSSRAGSYGPIAAAALREGFLAAAVGNAAKDVAPRRDASSPLRVAVATVHGDPAGTGLDGGSDAGASPLAGPGLGPTRKLLRVRSKAHSSDGTRRDGGSLVVPVMGSGMDMGGVSPRGSAGVSAASYVLTLRNVAARPDSPTPDGPEELSGMGLARALRSGAPQPSPLGLSASHVSASQQELSAEDTRRRPKLLPRAVTVSGRQTVMQREEEQAARVAGAAADPFALSASASVGRGPGPHSPFNMQDRWPAHTQPPLGPAAAGAAPYGPPPRLRASYAGPATEARGLRDSGSAGVPERGMLPRSPVSPFKPNGLMPPATGTGPSGTLPGMSRRMSDSLGHARSGSHNMSHHTSGGAAGRSAGIGGGGASGTLVLSGEFPGICEDGEAETVTAGFASGMLHTTGSHAHARERPSNARVLRLGFWKSGNKVARSFAAALLNETLRAASSNALGADAAVAHQSVASQPAGAATAATASVRRSVGDGGATLCDINAMLYSELSPAVHSASAAASSAVGTPAAAPGGSQPPLQPGAPPAVPSRLFPSGPASLSGLAAAAAGNMAPRPSSWFGPEGPAPPSGHLNHTAIKANSSHSSLMLPQNASRSPLATQQGDRHDQRSQGPILQLSPEGGLEEEREQRQRPDQHSQQLDLQFPLSFSRKLPQQLPWQRSEQQQFQQPAHPQRPGVIAAAASARGPSTQPLGSPCSPAHSPRSPPNLLLPPLLPLPPVPSGAPQHPGAKQLLQDSRQAHSHSHPSAGPPSQNSLPHSHAAPHPQLQLRSASHLSAASVMLRRLRSTRGAVPPGGGPALLGSLSLRSVLGGTSSGRGGGASSGGVGGGSGATPCSGGCSPVGRVAASMVSRMASRKRMSHTGGPARPDAAGLIPLFRGLRVRVGLHSGLDRGSDVFWTKRSGRRAYSGPAMRAARLLSDAALGGMVVLSGAALELLRPLPNERLPAGAMVWHSGRYRLGDREGCADVDVYQALLPSLLPRLQAFRGVPLRAAEVLQPGLLDCLVGPLALATCQVVGVEVLRSWDCGVADAALALFRSQAAEVAAEHGGSVVDLEGGTAVAAFARAPPSVSWLLALEDDLKSRVAWPAELLEHELGEEISCLLPGPDGLVVTQLVHCGPRVRCAAEWYGDVRLDLAVTRGVQLYRNAAGGKHWKNLQRLVRQAKMGQTLISGTLHRLVLSSAPPALLDHLVFEQLLALPRGAASVDGARQAPGGRSWAGAGTGPGSSAPLSPRGPRLGRQRSVDHAGGSGTAAGAGAASQSRRVATVHGQATAAAAGGAPEGGRSSAFMGGVAAALAAMGLAAAGASLGGGGRLSETGADRQGGDDGDGGEGGGSVAVVLSGGGPLDDLAEDEPPDWGQPPHGSTHGSLSPRQAASRSRIPRREGRPGSGRGLGLSYAAAALGLGLGTGTGTGTGSSAANSSNPSDGSDLDRGWHILRRRSHTMRRGSVAPLGHNPDVVIISTHVDGHGPGTMSPQRPRAASRGGSAHAYTGVDGGGRASGGTLDNGGAGTSDRSSLSAALSLPLALMPRESQLGSLSGLRRSPAAAPELPPSLPPTVSGAVRSTVKAAAPPPQTEAEVEPKPREREQEGVTRQEVAGEDPQQQQQQQQQQGPGQGLLGEAAEPDSDGSYELTVRVASQFLAEAPNQLPAPADTSEGMAAPAAGLHVGEGAEGAVSLQPLASLPRLAGQLAQQAVIAGSGVALPRTPSAARPRSGPVPVACSGNGALVTALPLPAATTAASAPLAAPQPIFPTPPSSPAASPPSLCTAPPQPRVSSPVAPQALPPAPLHPSQSWFRRLPRGLFAWQPPHHETQPPRPQLRGSRSASQPRTSTSSPPQAARPPSTPPAQTTPQSPACAPPVNAPSPFAAARSGYAGGGPASASEILPERSDGRLSHSRSLPHPQPSAQGHLPPRPRPPGQRLAVQAGGSGTAPAPGTAAAQGGTPGAAAAHSHHPAAAPGPALVQLSPLPSHHHPAHAAPAHAGWDAPPAGVGAAGEPDPAGEVGHGERAAGQDRERERERSSRLLALRGGSGRNLPLLSFMSANATHTGVAGAAGSAGPARLERSPRVSLSSRLLSSDVDRERNAVYLVKWRYQLRG